MIAKMQFHVKYNKYMKRHIFMTGFSHSFILLMKSCVLFS